MNKHRTYWPLDESPATDGDARFDGVNLRVDPANLQPGEGALGINVRFDEGRAATRKGIRILAWGAQGYQYQEPDIILPYGSDIRLAEAYNDPITGREWLIIVTSGGIYKTSPGTTGTPMPIAAGQSVAGATDLIQTYTGMVLLRGSDESPLYMRDVDEGWLVLPAAGAGTEALPPSTSGIYFQNRLCVVDGRADAAHADSVWVSDFGASGSTLQGSAAYQSFKINQGSSDRLTALAKFNETTLVCAKSKSIYVVSNIYGTNEEIAQNARLDEITRQYGCRAARSWVQVGADLWFMGHRRGVCSLRLTETNALQGVDVPVSRDIQPLVERINWEHADGIVAASHDNRVFFAVPLDDSQDNNAVLVFSTLTGKWAGYDQSDATKVRDWVKFTYAGAVRLGFVSTDGFICLYEDGYHDHTGDGSGAITYNAIAATFRTRGYLGQFPGNKRGIRVTARLLTWDGAFSATAIADGRGETSSVATVTRDNTAYIRPHGKADWDPVNAAGDWDTPWREDYSLMPDGTQVTDDASAGTVAFDALQEIEEVWNLRRTRCHHAQIQFASSRGRLEVAATTVQAIRGSSRSKPHA